jgi:ribosomal protein S7
MKKRFRDLTEKYKTCRLQPDPLFQSRMMQTLFNKFTKKGKKSLARRHIVKGLAQLRMVYHRPRTSNALTRIIRSLHVPMLLVDRRKGKTIESVPVTVRRNKRVSLALTALSNAVRARRERALHERIQQELLAVTAGAAQSTTIRTQTAAKRLQAEERANYERRYRLFGIGPDNHDTGVRDEDRELAIGLFGVALVGYGTYKWRQSGRVI